MRLVFFLISEFLRNSLLPRGAFIVNDVFMFQMCLKIWPLSLCVFFNLYKRFSSRGLSKKFEI